MRLIWLSLLIALLLQAAALREFVDCLSDKQLAILANMTDSSDHLHVPSGSLLAPFLVPRVSGTANNSLVRSFIADFFHKLNWNVDIDEFSQKTPIGLVRFANVIATKHIQAPRKLILACHFDSKYFPPPNNDIFIGATDSAAPCAILLEIASTVDSILSQIKGVPPISLQVIFFDGEEAFKNWSAEDSLYGSRHLARRWSIERPIHTNPTVNLSELVNAVTIDAKDSFRLALANQNTYKPAASIIQQIDLFVLLDLLGSDKPWPEIHDHSEATTKQFEQLVQLEDRLFGLGLLKGRDDPDKRYFLPAKSDPFVAQHGQADLIEDDHRPFAERNVPILHLIPIPFPEVWHTFNDNATALDQEIIRDYSKIFRAFVVQYLGLFLPA